MAILSVRACRREVQAVYIPAGRCTFLGILLVKAAEGGNGEHRDAIMISLMDSIC
jgi:hypothetical protein